MTQCEVCGNDYDKTIKVIVNGKNHTFDCFECAIQLNAKTSYFASSMAVFGCSFKKSRIACIPTR
jgi:hypothetical protein